MKYQYIHSSVCCPLSLRRLLLLLLLLRLMMPLLKSLSHSQCFIHCHIFLHSKRRADIKWSISYICFRIHSSTQFEKKKDHSKHSEMFLHTAQKWKIFCRNARSCTISRKTIQENKRWKAKLDSSLSLILTCVVCLMPFEWKTQWTWTFLFSWLLSFLVAFASLCFMCFNIVMMIHIHIRIAQDEEQMRCSTFCFCLWLRWTRVVPFQVYYSGSGLLSTS